MKLKFSNTRVVVLGLALLMINVKPALSVTIKLTTAGADNGSCSFSAISPNSSGDLLVECNPITTGAPSCGLTPSLTSTSGAPVTLNATCIPSATSYTWTGTGTTSFTGGGNVSPLVTTTYTVKGSNSAGTGNTASMTVTIPSIGGGGGGGGTDSGWVVPTNCKIIPVTWNSSLDLVSSSKTPLQHMAQGQMIAFSMKVPPRTSQSTPAMTTYSTVSKTMSITKNACDFSESLGYKTLGLNSCLQGGRPEVLIWNGGENQAGSYCHLPNEGETVYFNVRNGSSSTSADSCPAGKDCTFYFSW